MQLDLLNQPHQSPTVAATSRPFIGFHQRLFPLLLTKHAFNIDPPRDYQIESINHLASNDDTYLALVRKTADGKSLVPLTVALLRTGISITLVPTHGLGSDQVVKSNITELGVEAYYVNEHKQSSCVSVFCR